MASDPLNDQPDSPFELIDNLICDLDDPVLARNVADFKLEFAAVLRLLIDVSAVRLGNVGETLVAKSDERTPIVRDLDAINQAEAWTESRKQVLDVGPAYLDQLRNIWLTVESATTGEQVARTDEWRTKVERLEQLRKINQERARDLLARSPDLDPESARLLNDAADGRSSDGVHSAMHNLLDASERMATGVLHAQYAFWLASVLQAKEQVDDIVSARKWRGRVRRAWWIFLLGTVIAVGAIVNLATGLLPDSLPRRTAVIVLLGVGYALLERKTDPLVGRLYAKRLVRDVWKESHLLFAGIAMLSIIESQLLTQLADHDVKVEFRLLGPSSGDDGGEVADVGLPVS